MYNCIITWIIILLLQVWSSRYYKTIMAIIITTITYPCHHFAVQTSVSRGGGSIPRILAWARWTLSVSLSTADCSSSTRLKPALRRPVWKQTQNNQQSNRPVWKQTQNNQQSNRPVWKQTQNNQQSNRPVWKQTQNNQQSSRPVWKQTQNTQQSNKNYKPLCRPI